MGKLLALLLLIAVVACAFVPIGGRSIWTRACERGLPRRAAVAVAHGLRSGWNFVASSGHGAPEPARSTQPTREPPAHSPPRRRTEARAAHAILPQPPKEKLQRDDRDALDRLVRGSVSREQ